MRLVLSRLPRVDPWGNGRYVEVRASLAVGSCGMGCVADAVSVGHAVLMQPRMMVV